ncbi:hypothetical protein HK099_007344 [Clydaea vesicula]|uniref:Uncharacterized protein n=1 Tax=Clydaea vesicula TaxID=447962 RepID=A0AAD5U5N1_9FUNG|nr:hypothetical protein HK099_007344 [Clydaea vesicula]
MKEIYTLGNLLAEYTKGLSLGFGLALILTTALFHRNSNRYTKLLAYVIGFSVALQAIWSISYDVLLLPACNLKVKVCCVLLYCEAVAYWLLQLKAAHGLNKKMPKIKVILGTAFLIRFGIMISTLNAYSGILQPNGTCATYLPLTFGIIDQTAEMLYSLLMTGLFLLSVNKYRNVGKSENVKIGIIECKKCNNKNRTEKIENILVLLSEQEIVLVFSLLFNILYDLFVFTQNDSLRISIGHNIVNKKKISTDTMTSSQKSYGCSSKSTTSASLKYEEDSEV